MKSIEQQIKDNQVPEDHPLYPFKDGYSVKLHLEATASMALKGLEGLLSAEETAKILKKAFSPEYLGEICKELLIK